MIFYVIGERDRRIVTHDARYHSTMDSAAMEFSSVEIHTANTFIDSTLPALRSFGLIVNVEQNTWETLILVNGAMWRERSQFFKESFLQQLSTYNRVRKRPSAVRIVDQQSGRMVAQIFLSGQKEVFE